MSPPSANDPRPLQRSGRATAALVISFAVAAGLTIIGHLDRVNAAPADAMMRTMAAPDTAEISNPGVAPDAAAASGTSTAPVERTPVERAPAGTAPVASAPGGPSARADDAAVPAWDGASGPFVRAHQLEGP